MTEYSKEFISAEMDKILNGRTEWATVHPTEAPPAIIHFYRGEETVAKVFSTMERDPMLTTIRKGMFGFSADLVLFSGEAWSATTEINPETGQKWEAGEIGLLAKEYPEHIESGLITDSYIITAYARDGHEWGRHVPFRVDGETITWGEAANFDNGDDGSAIDGYMSDCLTYAMTDGTAWSEMHKMMSADTEMHERFPDWDSYERRESALIVMDFSNVAHLGKDENVLASMIAAKPDSFRAEYLLERKDSLMERMRENGDISVKATLYGFGPDGEPIDV